MTPASFRAHRKRMGRTQAQWADDLGISKKRVQIIEAGVRDGDRKVIVRQVERMAVSAALHGLPPAE